MEDKAAQVAALTAAGASAAVAAILTVGAEEVEDTPVAAAVAAVHTKAEAAALLIEGQIKLIKSEPIMVTDFV
jgi:hypothetical protein